MKNQFIIITTTYQNLEKAKNLAKILLTEKLAACVQFCEIESSYFWQGEIKNDKEILVKIKTKTTLYEQIEKIIVKHHEYKTPEIVSSLIDQGFAPYLEWIETNCI